MNYGRLAGLAVSLRCRRETEFQIECPLDLVQLWNVGLIQGCEGYQLT